MTFIYCVIKANFIGGREDNYAFIGQQFWGIIQLKRAVHTKPFKIVDYSIEFIEMQTNKQKLLLSIALTGLIFVAELVGGLLTGSL